MSLAVLLLSVALGPHATDSPPPPVKIVRSEAVRCGLKVQNLRVLEGSDVPSHWTIVPEADGTLPDYKAFDCLLRWAETQKGLHIGFVGQEGTDSPPVEEPVE